MYTEVMKTYERVKGIIARHIDISNISDDDLLENTGLNSLDIVEISAEIEEAFNLELTSDEIISIKTIRDIVCLIEQKRK